MLRLVREFYRQPFAWLFLAITDLTLVYGGGAAMFWYHSYFLGEGGPAISPYLHWFVDSTAGLVGLTPALFVILPIAARAAWDGSAQRSAAAVGEIVRERETQALQAIRGIRPVSFAAVGGILFTLATAPGPLVHDSLVGRGTWLAAQITRMWGDGRPPVPHHQLTPMAAILTQEAFGLPLYVALVGAVMVSMGLVVRLVDSRLERVDVSAN